MQNRYVGDVGDFGKFGLLRFLSGMTDSSPEPKLRIGLVWCLHHDEKHTSANRVKISADGRHISYLRRTATNDRSEYRNCDVNLWEGLRDLVYRDGRCVHCAENARFLPGDTAYYSDQLHLFKAMPRDLMKQVRAAWVKGAFKAMSGLDIVCFDPDNGIGADKKMYSKDGAKYVYLKELKLFWERDQSLVVYHHMAQGRTARAQTLEVADTLRAEFEVEAIPLLFSRGTSRVFFVVPQPDEKEAVIEARIERLLDTGCNRHFERIPAVKLGSPRQSAGGLS